MRIITLPLALAGAAMIGGCAGGYGADPLGGILGSVLGGGYPTGGYGYPGGGYGGASFEQAAVNACGAQASRYGRVSIREVRQQSSSTLRVYGWVERSAYDRDEFACSFRSDGRITDFDI